MTGPDLSSGRVPLDRSAAEYTPEIDNIDAVHPHLERRVRAAPAVRLSRSTSPMSAPRASADMPVSTSTLRRLSVW
jgi:hypothetical protein